MTNMNRHVFYQLLNEQREERNLRYGEDLVKRESAGQIDVTSQLVQIISGIRRSGKSTLAHQVYGRLDYAYINFDDERLLSCTVEDLNLLLELLYQIYGDFKYLLLDEIQNIDGWSLFVNRLLRKKIHIIITGSNSRLLSTELATHLTGRFLNTELFPFSFREYLIYKEIGLGTNTTKEIGLLKGLFTEYARGGGFPEVVRGERLEGYVTALFDSIVSRDIVFRHNIKYVRTFRDIAIYLVNNYSSELSFNRIKKIFGLGSENTAKTYVTYLEEAYLVLTLPKFSFKKQEQLRYRKTYVADPAMISVMSDNFSGNRGRVMENIVFLELKRRSARTGFEIYYYKKLYSVDFVIYSKGQVTTLIQVSESLQDKVTRNREVRALLNASAELSPLELKIITLDENMSIEEDGCSIDVVSVINWLLEPES